MYVLIICAGISMMGCGVISETPPMPKEDCFAALAAIRFDVDNPGNSRRSAYAYCTPVNTRLTGGSNADD